MTMQTFREPTAEQLRAAGSLKWAYDPGALPMWVAEMDFGVAPAIRDALHAAVDDAPFGYMPPALPTAMGEACALWLETTSGWRVAPERIRPLADVLTAFEHAMTTFLPAGGAVIVPTPAYMPFLTMPAEHGLETIEMPLDQRNGRFVINPEHLAAAFEAGGRLLVLCDPHNPTGTVYTAQEHAEVAEVVEAYGGRVFSDEIHAPILYSGSVHIPYASVSEQAASHSITALSAAKGWNLPGLKTAQLVLTNEADADLWKTEGWHYEHGASTLGVVAATAAFGAGGGWMSEVCGYLQGNRDHAISRLRAELPRTHPTVPAGTYFLWLDFREYGLGNAPAQAIRERTGVLFTNGAACGSLFSGFLRMNFATPRPVLDEVLDRVVADLTA